MATSTFACVMNLSHKHALFVGAERRGSHVDIS